MLFCSGDRCRFRSIGPHKLSRLHAGEQPAMRALRVQGDGRIGHERAYS